MDEASTAPTAPIDTVSNSYPARAADRMRARSARLRMTAPAPQPEPEPEPIPEPVTVPKRAPVSQSSPIDEDDV